MLFHLEECSNDAKYYEVSPTVASCNVMKLTAIGALLRYHRQPPAHVQPSAASYDSRIGPLRRAPSLGPRVAVLRMSVPSHICGRDKSFNGTPHKETPMVVPCRSVCNAVSADHQCLLGADGAVISGDCGAVHGRPSEPPLLLRTCADGLWPRGQRKFVYEVLFFFYLSITL